LICGIRDMHERVVMRSLRLQNGDIFSKRLARIANADDLIRLSAY
jgi:hypothetical protein